MRNMSRFQVRCSNQFTLILNKEKDPTRIAILIDALFNFLVCQVHIDLAINWLEAESILNNGTKIPNAKLNQSHKFLIVEAVYSKNSISIEMKNKLLSKVVGEEKSDIEMNFILSCEALTPNSESKQKVWTKIVDYNSNLSTLERTTMMKCFFNRDSYDIIEPYFNKYWELINEFASCPWKEFFEEFWEYLTPTFNITDELIDTLKKNAREYEHDVEYESYYRNVHKVIGKLQRIKNVKDFSAD